jgi:uncharacterized protein YndB with AHSA1/START domain
MSESQDQVAVEKPSVEREAVLPAGLDEVWEALTDEDRLAEWLADDVELDPVEGGDLSVRDGDGDVREGTVETVIERERLTFTWARPDEEPSRVEFVVLPDPGGTRLLVTETLIASPVALAGAHGSWDHRLLRLCRAVRLAPVA